VFTLHVNSGQWRASPLFIGSDSTDPNWNGWAGSDLVQKKERKKKKRKNIFEPTD
jgi:hypothetical protein